MKVLRILCLLAVCVIVSIVALRSIGTASYGSSQTDSVSGIIERVSGQNQSVHCMLYNRYKSISGELRDTVTSSNGLLSVDSQIETAKTDAKDAMLEVVKRDVPVMCGDKDTEMLLDLFGGADPEVNNYLLGRR